MQAVSIFSTQTVTITATPLEHVQPGASWASDTPAVATVALPFPAPNNSGLRAIITAHAVGIAKVTCTAPSAGGPVSQSFVVIVDDTEPTMTGVFGTPQP